MAAGIKSSFICWSSFLDTNLQLDGSEVSTENTGRLGSSRLFKGPVVVQGGEVVEAETNIFAARLNNAV